MPAPVPHIDSSFAAFRLAIRSSPIHRWGVYALEDVPPRRKVIEYTGQKINRREAKKRGRRRHIYLFSLDNYWCIDGAVCGSGAECINHSCEPNLKAVIMRGHILFMSVRPIAKGEELTIDYHIGKNIRKIPCKCGTAGCRGTLNVQD